MNKRILIYITALVLAIGVSCRLEMPQAVVMPLASIVPAFRTDSPEPVTQDPVVDSLVATFKGMSVAVKHNRPDVFLAFLDPHEKGSLQVQSRRYGYNSLKTYLMNSAVAWPDPDTLQVGRVVSGGDYARLTLIGPGAKLRDQPPQVRYTFILFRRDETGWKLSALCPLERPMVDRYGFPIVYHETDLPPKLRFPRFF